VTYVDLHNICNPAVSAKIDLIQSSIGRTDVENIIAQTEPTSDAFVAENQCSVLSVYANFIL